MVFGTRLVWRFKVASVWFSFVQDSFGLVQGCFSLVWFGSRYFQLFKVTLAVQGCFISGRSCWWFKVALLWFVSRISSVQFKVDSTVQGHVDGWFGSFGFIWFKVASLLILMSVRFKADNYFSFGREFYFGASVTSEGSLEFYGCFYKYGFSNLLQLEDCKSPAFHHMWPPQEVIHETTPITSCEPMRG
jgi:hypothetical protein